MNGKVSNFSRLYNVTFIEKCISLDLAVCKSWDLGAWHNEVERTGNETVTTTSVFLLSFYSLVARKIR